MKTIIFNENEIEAINQNGEICEYVARRAMERSCLSFDDIERINDHYETHSWGSTADRRYRKSAVYRAIQKVCRSPKQYSNQF
jgi:hypothetical protein